MSISRRSIFGLGVAATATGAAAGISGVNLLKSAPKEKLPVPKELATTLTLQQKYDDGKPINIGFGEHVMYLGIPSPIKKPETKSIALTVGPDGHMYVRVNDTWKRVVTEA